MKPTIPKGTRDFTPEVYAKRKYIFNVIENVFKMHGYKAIETPAIENLSTLTGKYGAEGDRLIFKILNSGDYLKNIETSDKNELDYKKLTPKISEKALRYDLTVPFARFVVMNRNEITFPFKRYQIQPVWRADRPQKGRYREFYQCDVDVIGSNSVLNEVDLIQIIDGIFTKLNIPVTIFINSRKILDGLVQDLELNQFISEVLIALDKLDKQPVEKVKIELGSKIGAEKADRLFKKIDEIVNTDLNKLKFKSEIGNEGINELSQIIEFGSASLSSGTSLDFNINLARGLDYYTGTIIEVKANNFEMGSICGGGRYDNLTDIFGLKGVSGVGISFGADRIYDVLNASDSFKNIKLYSSKIMFINFGKDETKTVNRYLKSIREKMISAELFPDTSKLGKQFSYANSNNIPFVAMVGEEELKANKIKIKNMNDGSENLYSETEMLALLLNG